MSLNHALPALRASLDAIPMEHEGRTMVLLRDNEGFLQDTFLLSPAGMLAASFLDGHNTLDDVQQLFQKRTGFALSVADLENLVNQLKGARLLDTPEVRAAREERRRDFYNSAVRAPVHVGGGYPADPAELTKFLEKFQIPEATEDAAQSEIRNPKSEIVGLLAPHIDFHRGGAAYASAYGALAGSRPPDAIVAIGVAHSSPVSPWVMTPKGYQTPFGSMSVHEELYKEVADCLDYDPRADEEVHRGEHSLEFQAIWLKHLWKEAAPPWVPILSSTLERYAGESSPKTADRIEKMLVAVAARLRQFVKGGRRLLVLGGIDLAHVGPRFGDQLPLNAETKARVRAADRQSLQEALKLRAEPFYMAGVGDGAWRKVCGLSATYTALRWIEAIAPSARGTLLAYDQAPDPMGGIVSFTSVSFR
jgi:MEMO1 family protein